MGAHVVLVEAPLMKQRPAALTVESPAGQRGAQRRPLPLRASDMMSVSSVGSMHSDADPSSSSSARAPPGLRVSIPAKDIDVSIRERAKARAKTMVQMEEHKRLESVRMVQGNFESVKTRAKNRAKTMVAREYGVAAERGDMGELAAASAAGVDDQFTAQLLRFRQTAAARHRSARVMLANAGAGKQVNPCRHHRRLSVPSTPTSPLGLDSAVSGGSPQAKEDLAAIAVVAGMAEPEPEPEAIAGTVGRRNGLPDRHAAALLAFRKATQTFQRRHLEEGARVFSSQVLDSVAKGARQHRRMSCPTVLPSDRKEILRRLETDQNDEDDEEDGGPDDSEATTTQAPEPAPAPSPVTSVAELFDMIDTDHSESISFAELTAWWADRVQSTATADNHAGGTEGKDDQGEALLRRMTALVADLDDTGDGELGRSELTMLLQELIIEDPLWCEQHGEEEEEPNEDQICEWLSLHHFSLLTPRPPGFSPAATRARNRERRQRRGLLSMAKGPPMADDAVAAAAAASHHEDMLVARSALTLHFHQQQILHVRGIGAHGWDGTEEGTGEYESEEALEKIFSLYGEVSRVRIA